MFRSHTMIYDITVLGGGIVGLTIANLCSQAGLSVALVEAKKPNFNWEGSSFDLRCSAINRGSQNIFESIDIWHKIVEMTITPYQRMVVWDAAGFGEIQFDAEEINESNLGHIIENRVMLKALWEKVYQHNIAIILSKPSLVQKESDHILLKLENNAELKSKLIIGADGGNSWLREQGQFTTIKRDYQQKALVANITTELPHQSTAWQRFLATGPLAFLPLSEPHTTSIVWSADLEKNDYLMSLEPNTFCQELAHQFDYRLGKVVSTSERASFPLTMIYAKQSIMERMALIGDAAHVIHPLAGQGVNLGLSDAYCLAEILIHAKNNHYDIGHHLVLRKYERARKGAVRSMIAAMDFFKQSFGSELSFIAGMRSFGLNFVNKNRYLKKRIMLKAMGA